jgi:hypothetical protein
MFNTLFSPAALGWWGRRLADWGGWLGTTLSAVIGIYLSLPERTREEINQALQGNWQDITLGSLVGFVVLVWSQVASFRATTAQQIVTEDGKKIDTRDLPSNKKVFVEEAANVADAKKKAARKPNLLDRLFGR